VDEGAIVIGAGAISGPWLTVLSGGGVEVAAIVDPLVEGARERPATWAHDPSFVSHHWARVTAMDGRKRRTCCPRR